VGDTSDRFDRMAVTTREVGTAVSLTTDLARRSPLAPASVQALGRSLARTGGEGPKDPARQHTGYRRSPPSGWSLSGPVS
jgi:uncharacterized membrane protein